MFLLRTEHNTCRVYQQEFAICLNNGLGLNYIQTTKHTCISPLVNVY